MITLFSTIILMIMAKVIAPMFSIKAEGTFAKQITFVSIRKANTLTTRSTESNVVNSSYGYGFTTTVRMNKLGVRNKSQSGIDVRTRQKMLTTLVKRINADDLGRPSAFPRSIKDNIERALRSFFTPNSFVANRRYKRLWFNWYINRFCVHRYNLFSNLLNDYVSLTIEEKAQWIALNKSIPKPFFNFTGVKGDKRIIPPEFLIYALVQSFWSVRLLRRDYRVTPPPWS